MGYISYPFTWNNHRVGRANIQERLDRGLSNTCWRLLFPQATIHHLPAFRSDHKPLVLHSVPSSPSRPKPFRFEEMWIRDPTIGAVIAKVWSRGSHQPDINQIMSNLKITKLALKSWNKYHFGNIHAKIKELHKYIETLQAMPQSYRALELEGATQAELDEIWSQEMLLWKVKAKAKWIAEGDANTCFFHISTITHRRYNHIHTILTDANSRVCDSVRIGEIFVEYYKNLFTSADHRFPNNFQSLIPTTIDAMVNWNFIRVMVSLEVL